MITLTGPWLGVEERENYQTPKHCSIALNCDFTSGNIEARKGFKRIHAHSNTGALFTHLVKKNGKPKILVEGWVTMEEVGAFLQMGDDGDLDDLLAGKYVVAAEPAPKKKRASKKAAEPVEEPEQEEEEPEQDLEEEQEEEAEPAPAPKRRARRTAA